MSTSTLSTLLSNGITTFWDYVTTIFPTLLTFVIAVAVVGLVFWLVAKTIRHIF